MVFMFFLCNSFGDEARLRLRKLPMRLIASTFEEVDANDK